MKKVLWCGGSHMGNLRSAMFSSNKVKSLLENHNNSFFPTAAGDLWAWYNRGGKLKVCADGVAFRNSPELFSASGEPLYGEMFDLNRYDAIVFVGQWIRPLQFLGVTDWFKSNKGLSAELMSTISRNVIDNPFIPGSGLNQIPNEPLTLFPNLAKDPFRIILVPDPLPGVPPENELLLRPKNYRDQYKIYQSNLSFVDVYFRTLESICCERGISYCFQPESTYDNASLTTKRKFLQFEDEFIHVNEEFYLELLSNKLCPMIDKIPSIN